LLPAFSEYVAIDYGDYYQLERLKGRLIRHDKQSVSGGGDCRTA
jgi:hypothetical protein